VPPVVATGATVVVTGGGVTVVVAVVGDVAGGAEVVADCVVVRTVLVVVRTATERDLCPGAEWAASPAKAPASAVAPKTTKRVARRRRATPASRAAGS
jgi:hypothetical protein